MTAARVLFAGTPDFARESLRALLESGVVPQLVLTQPDRPAGRGRKLTVSPVKQFALEHGIPVWQPESMRDAEVVVRLQQLDLDLMIVAAYGLILPQAVLDVPRLGCVNVHASLLPRWRGAAPIQAAILAGDKETGISLMQMTAGMDEGPLIERASIEIGAQETAGELRDRLAVLGGELLVQAVPEIMAGRCVASPQDEQFVTYAPKIKSKDARLDWTAPASDLVRIVRAYNPVPGASFEFRGERIKCWHAISVVAADLEEAPGTVITASKTGIDVFCGKHLLRLLELQRPGKNRVSAAEFAGQVSLPGCRFE
jgi:methionyl-tRNA formyltransferase